MSGSAKLKHPETAHETQAQAHESAAFEARMEAPDARCDRLAATQDASKGLEIFMGALAGRKPVTLPGELADDLNPLLARILG